MQQDTRVHACLYFIAPSGHGLKNIDVQFMKNLQHKVNLVPVIGKSDAFTNEEIVEFKEKIQGSPSHLLLLSQIKFSRRNQDLTAFGKVEDGQWTRASNGHQNSLQVHCITKERVNWS